MQVKLERNHDSMNAAHPKAEGKPAGVVGGGKGDKYRFTLLADGLIRYEWAPDGHFEDRPSSFAIHRHVPKRKVPKYDVKETDDTLEIITSRFHLTYNKQEFSPYGLFVLVLNFTRHLWRYGEPLETLGGTARTLDGVDGRIAVEPGVVARKGFASIDDSDTMLFEDDGFVAPRRPGPGRVDGYLFAYGNDYRGAVKALYDISGYPLVLPRWALGNWWSRYYEYSADSYVSLMDKFRDHDIPLSVAVLDMDWHLVDDPKVIEAGQTGWTGYTWNKELFPDPPAFLNELHNRKLKTTLNDHPADGVHSFEDLYEKFARAVHRDPATKQPIPFDITDRDYLKAYFNVLIRSLEDDGCDFIWIDWQQGQYSRLRGIDPLWVLNHFHFLHNAERNRRPIIFSRYGGPGSHRYPVGFSGDTIVSWASLDFQPEFTATASNIGYGWWSHDIGGHMFGVKDDELTARWVQLGVFSPIMRLHSSKSKWVAKEAWKLPGGPREVITDFLRLRHRLIPYLHTMNVRAAEKGEPLVQPMYWAYPDSEEAYGVRNQYLFGTELIVIPITTPEDPHLKMGRVRGWLPPGTYVDYFSGMVYDGNRELWISRPLDRYPVFLKEGSIVPLDESLTPANGGDNPNGFEVVVAIGADGYFEILEDGPDTEQSTESQSTAQWDKIPITFTQDKGTLEIGPAQKTELSNGTEAETRTWTVRFVGIRDSKAVRVLVNENEAEDSTTTEVDNGLLVRIGKLSPKDVVTVELGAGPQFDRNEPKSLIEPVINNAQIGYELKDAIWDVVSNTKISRSAQIGKLHSIDMSEPLRLAVLEYLLAEDRL